MPMLQINFEWMFMLPSFEIWKHVYFVIMVVYTKLMEGRTDFHWIIHIHDQRLYNVRKIQTLCTRDMAVAAVAGITSTYGPVGMGLR